MSPYSKTIHFPNFSLNITITITHLFLLSNCILTGMPLVTGSSNITKNASNTVNFLCISNRKYVSVKNASHFFY